MSNLLLDPSFFHVQAITLKHYPVNESDRLVVVLTREQGVLRLIAKGARKPRHHLAGRLDLLRCNHLVLKRSRCLHQITQCDSAHHFSLLYHDYDRLLYAMAIGELLTVFCQEADPLPKIYDLALLALSSLNTDYPALPVLIWFEWHLLQHLGYCHNFQTCYFCERHVLPQHHRFFDLQHGGMVCHNCKIDRTVQFLNPDIWQCWEALYGAPYPHQSPLFSLEIWQQAQHMLAHYVQHVAEKELHCFAAMKSTHPVLLA